ncbi:protein RST1 isoform X2 [Morus notabilis]|uniref:protein RST1 isoform X2 n=1 Tax=Morus notabilis TaxID=981085 RepID=UPI000CED0670|nr:protein RST1 isoform X2 [Morus notabilis]
MDSYSPLLEKLRVPQPSLQKLAVISIFSKLRSAPKYLDSDSDPGRDAINQCLHSASPAIVDQSVRELCRLVADSLMDVSRGLLELQSALEGCEPRFVDLFVKALGFLVRLGLQKNSLKWRLASTESHPFVKVLSCGSEVQSELVQQILLLMAYNKQLGIVDVCEFLRPFLNYSILRISFSDSSSSMFARHLISSLASLCCSFSLEAIPVLKLLTEVLRYIPCKNSEDSRNFICFVENMVDAHVVILRHLARKGLVIAEAQLCSLELLETILSVCSCHRYSYWIEPIAEVSRRLLFVHKDLGFRYVSKLSSAILSLFVILIKTELEHEQLSILRLLHFLLNWKYGNELLVGDISYTLSEEVLLIFPVISLLSSPSKSVKGAATDLLIILEKILVGPFVSPENKPTKGEFPPISTLGSVVCRLLQHQWFQDQYSPSSLFLSFASSCETDSKELHDVPRSWPSQLRSYCLSIVDRRKSFLPLSPSQEIFVSEMPMLLSAIAGVLLMHQSLGSIVVDSLNSIAMMDSKTGTQFLLAILFYSNVFTKKDVIGQNMLLKLLGMLPALASHSWMTPVIVQTILPMLQKDSKPTLYATAIRLLCQTWEMNDRAFGSLQGVLLPKAFTEFKSQRNICISIASSIKYVCRKNPDRGVDLILSVSACIESRDPIIQAFGFQSLAHLCEADVIDFYTAWDVISKHVLDYSADSILAHSICLLLRWGAMDAEAYPEASKDVLQILWGISISTPDQARQWERARISALEALAQYEVSLIEQKLPDFKKLFADLLFSETNLHVLRVVEELQVKIITYEHITRRRLRKEKGVAGSRVEKLLDVFPQVIFSSGKGNNARDLAGAALLCLSFTPKVVNSQRTSKGLSDVHAEYEKALLELATSLQLLRNIFIALISLQSWKTFVRRWLRADILFFDAKAPSISLDKTTKAANDILKRMIQIAKDAIPRSSENIALAIGALCAVLPPSNHTVKSAASEFLLSWLFQHEHEHRQWSAAISLGLISSCLHVTDHKQKFQNITGLLEVLCKSKSTLVKGACGVGLGLSCQDLLNRVDTADNSDLDEETNKTSEADLLGNIVGTLSLIICQFTQSSFDIVESLSAYFPPNTYGIDANMNAELSHENSDNLEEDIWGVAGVVLGLARCIGPMYRAGLHDAVLKIKRLIVSWIPHLNQLKYSGSSSEILSVGSCLALPSIVAFCQRVELMDVNEVNQLMNGYRELISELVSVKRSGIFHQSLLMASCIGAGSLLACVLDEGVQSIEVQSVKVLLELFRKCYSDPYPPLVSLGGMLGVVNSMGANAGIFFQMHPRTVKLHTGYEKKESNHLIGPLLSSPNSEPHLTSLTQEIFLIAQNSDDHQLQQYAAWAVSLLRIQLWSKENLNLDVGIKTDIAGSESSQNFTDDNAVMKLSSWLMHLNISGTGGNSHISTVVTVLRCLSEAPRLPSLDWGAIVRRCMRYEAQASELLLSDPAYRKGVLREEFTSYQAYDPNQKSMLRKSCWKGLFQCFDEASIDSLEYASHIEKSMEMLFSLLPALQSDFTTGTSQVNYKEEWSDAVRCLAKARRSWLMNFLEVSQEDLLQKGDQFIEVLKKVQAKAKLTRIGCLASAELGRLKTHLLNTKFQGTWDLLIEVVAALQNVEGGVRRQWLIDAVEISCVATYPSTALQFLGLLAGSRSKYMPLLILDRHTVLSDLPVTLSSLLAEPGWRDIAESVASNLLASTERIYNWEKHITRDEDTTEMQPIDESENEMAGFVLRVVHRTCLSLKDYLPLEKQLKLASMVVD